MIVKNMIDIHKNRHVIYDNMSSLNRVCKGKCVNYKAKRPKTGSRYTAGQVRCQICIIYLTSDGVRDNRCKCCNSQVRTKPRNSLYKERFHQARDKQNQEIKQTSSDNWQLEKSTKEHKQDLSNDKKSTPIYEKTDETVKTYYEFKEFFKFCS